MKPGANFAPLLAGLDPELLSDVQKLYALEALEEAAACEEERSEIGQFNAVHPAPDRTRIGQLKHRLHVTDFWAQQVIHDAWNDPGLWKWFLKTPEGAYARVRSDGPARIVVPAWKGGLWNSVGAALPMKRWTA
jgi:hypothetical protein